VNLIVAVAVKEHQVAVAVIRPVAIPVMYFHHMRYREVQSTEQAMALVPLQQPDDTQRFGRIAS
jgi:hypothetical protein